MAKQPPNVVQRHADSDEDIEEDIEEDIVVGSDVEDMEEDIDIVDDGSRQDAATNKFDRLVGALEEVLMDPDFEEERESFCRGHCQHFEASDENKLIYTDVFAQYSQLVEGAIERRLKAAVPGFSMEEFMVMLDQRKDELMSDVFDFLLTLGDFEAFKESMLSYNKEQREGSILEVSCMAMPIHTEEQEDGDVRPDLDFGLTVSSIGAGNRGGSKPPAATPGAGSRHGGNNGGKRR